MDNSSTPGPTDNPLSPVPPTTPPKSRWYKRKLFWTPVLAILVVVAAGAGYLYYKSQPQQTAQHSTAVKTATSIDPQALVYVSSTAKVVAHCEQKTDTVHYVNLGDQKVTNAIALNDYQGVSGFATYHDAVVLATTPSCASKNGSSLWLSQDSGKTYKKIYTAESTSGRITSVAFSTDGSEVAFGLAGKSKTVRSIDVKSDDVRDLFTDNQTEHFGTFYDVKSYDREKQRVYYVEGCDTCDMITPSYLMQYDIKGGKSSTTIEQAKSMGSELAINDDATRAVRVEYASSEGSQLTQFTINEFDLTTKKLANFANYTGATSAGTTRAGYTADGSVYYTAGKKVMILKEGGETSELAQIPDQAAEVYYVGKSRVIYRTSDQSGGEVINYDIQSGKATRLLKYEYPTTPLGVS